MSKHYVARIIIEKVTRPVVKAKNSYESDTLGERQTVEIGNALVKGTDLKEMKERLFRAADQIEDYD